MDSARGPQNGLPAMSKKPGTPRGASEAPYETGYCKPPERTRWKKGGPSPNPKGRPKRANDLVSIAARVGRKKFPISIGGRDLKITYNEALVLGAYKDGINGGWRARETVARWDAEHLARQSTELDYEGELVIEVEMQLEEGGPEPSPPSPQVQRYLEQLKRARKI